MANKLKKLTPEGCFYSIPQTDAKIAEAGGGGGGEDPRIGDLDNLSIPADTVVEAINETYSVAADADYTAERLKAVVPYLDRDDDVDTVAVGDIATISGFYSPRILSGNNVSVTAGDKVTVEDVFIEPDDGSWEATITGVTAGDEEVTVTCDSKHGLVATIKIPITVTAAPAETPEENS